jgi:hypothetical protein
MSEAVNCDDPTMYLMIYPAMYPAINFLILREISCLHTPGRFPDLQSYPFQIQQECTPEPQQDTLQSVYYSIEGRPGESEHL